MIILVLTSCSGAAEQSADDASPFIQQGEELYEANCASCHGVLLWLRKKDLPNGALFAIFLAAYGTGRFFISFVREERIWLWGLQEAQMISLAAVAVAIVSLGYLVWQHQMNRERLLPETA